MRSSIDQKNRNQRLARDTNLERMEIQGDYPIEDGAIWKEISSENPPVLVHRL